MDTSLAKAERTRVAPVRCMRAAFLPHMAIGQCVKVAGPLAVLFFCGLPSWWGQW